MKRNIVIYQDEGVGEYGLSCLQSFFNTDSVRFVNAQEVIHNSAFKNADIFVIPGGADLPYCKKLNGEGNKNIRAFVEHGGMYLGICAGAYYACSSIEYHRGRSDEICERRELALIKATAIGSLPDLAPYYDQTLHSAAITPLKTAKDETVTALYYGGCTFDVKDQIIVIATYPDGRPAIIKKDNVILSGIHFEYGPDDILAYPCQDETEKKQADILANQLSSGRPDWNNLLFKDQKV